MGGGRGGCDIMEIIPVVEQTLSVQLPQYTGAGRESLEPVQAKQVSLEAQLVALLSLPTGESVSVGV